MSVKKSVKRLVPVVCMVIASAGVTLLGLGGRVNSLEVPAMRSLTLGDTTPGVITDYTLAWQYVNPATVGSIRFQFCDNSFVEELPCNNVAGGSFAAASLDAQIGVTGFSILSQSADEILLSRAPAATGPVSVSYTLGNVSNPPGLSDHFFIRILVYPSADGTGAYSHGGGVLSATAEPITINTEVPPELIFCVGITVDPNCASFTGNSINYGDLSPLATRYATSQFGVITNAAGGYVVTANGATMTSGSNLIEPLNPPILNLVGASQFGMNLRANTNPPIGADPSGLGTAVIGAGYNTPDIFKYVDGDVVASVPGPTHFNGFTVTYIVNVSPVQPSGIYNTTINYVCTASF